MTSSKVFRIVDGCLLCRGMLEGVIAHNQQHKTFLSAQCQDCGAHWIVNAQEAWDNVVSNIEKSLKGWKKKTTGNKKGSAWTALMSFYRCM